MFKLQRKSSYDVRLRGAFTLVEVLVVIGVIALLIALLVPAVARAKATALQQRCQQNERQIYLAAVMFSDEHRGLLPRPICYHDFGEPYPTNGAAFEEASENCLWLLESPGRANVDSGALRRYLGGSPASVILCPADAGETPFGDYFRWTTERNFSYSINCNVRFEQPQANLSSLKFAAIVHPAEKIFIWEELAPNDGCATMPFMYFDNLPAGRHGSTGVKGPRRVESYNWDWGQGWLFNGRGNYVFFDGHVESRPPIDLVRHREFFGPLTADGPVYAAGYDETWRPPLPYGWK
jgi:prepilin-type processing-associated H-X9-DG protein